MFADIISVKDRNNTSRTFTNNYSPASLLPRSGIRSFRWSCRVLPPTPPAMFAQLPTAAMAQPNSDGVHADLAQPLNQVAIDADGQRVEPELSVSMQDLALPLSAADGLIEKPFARPLDHVVPTARPTLTADQEKKYNDLLKRVSAWPKIPTKQAKGSTESPLTDRERMFLTRDCLQRYLRATTWNVVQAETRLKATLVWRRDYGVEELTAEYIGIENETGKQLILGYDVAARPCHYMNPSKQNTPRTDRQIEHLVYMLEREIDLMVPGQETLALLINFADTKSGQGASLGQGKQTLNILQNHYPERLGRALVTNSELPARDCTLPRC